MSGTRDAAPQQDDVAEFPDDRITLWRCTMDAKTRRKFSMVTKALEFSLANPSEDTGQLSVVTQLEGRVDRADALAIKERDGRVDEAAAVARRNDLRHKMQKRQLRHLAIVGAAAAKTRPDLAGQFVLPRSTGPNRTFLTAAKGLLALATTEEALLVSLGLGESFVAEFTAALSEYETATAVAHTGRRDHVGARADLKAVVEEGSDLVKLLDGFNQQRFAGNAELLGAWESVTNVYGRYHRSPETVDGGAEPVETAA